MKFLPKVALSMVALGCIMVLVGVVGALQRVEEPSSPAKEPDVGDISVELCLPPEESDPEPAPVAEATAAPEVLLAPIVQNIEEPEDVVEQVMDPEPTPTMMLPPVTTRPARFPNENFVRLNILEAQSILFEESLESDRYEQKLLELEALMAVSISHPEDLAAVIEESFASVKVEDERFAVLQEQMKQDVEKSLGYLWAQSDPEGSLTYAAENEEEAMLTGWMTAQMLAGEDVEQILDTYEIEPSDEVVWEALMDTSKSDTVSSLNQIVENHLDDMTMARWRELLFNGHNSSDSTLATWFQENAEVLEANENFDEVEVVRMLRRLDPGEGPFMNSVDLAVVDGALEEQNYPAAASLFEELSVLYDEKIDASAVGEMPLAWAEEDFTASSDWLLAHASKFSNQETLESLIGSVYRTGIVFGDDAETVLTSALAIEDETYRGMALSNVLIPQVEDLGVDMETEWVTEMEQGFAKQRTMAGFVLGLSRHSNEPTLEAQVKFQFLQDEYDFEVLKQLVEESELSPQEKRATLEFLDTY